jgi:hypothetical protein
MNNVIGFTIAFFLITILFTLFNSVHCIGRHKEYSVSKNDVENFWFGMFFRFVLFVMSLVLFVCYCNGLYK